MKFVFADDTLEVVLGEQQAETENAFVGGENKWAFSSFTNWEYWFPGFPILVYFKARARRWRCRWLSSRHFVGVPALANLVQHVGSWQGAGVDIRLEISA